MHKPKYKDVFFINITTRAWTNFWLNKLKKVIGMHNWDTVAPQGEKKDR